jgi:DNA-binding IclR family transcriptional regulator
MAAAKSPDYPVPALEKGLDIIEALAAASVPQSLVELAGRLDRSSSSIYRMLNCLERRGYVLRDPASGKYALSLKLFALAHTHSPTESLVQAARAPMQALTEKFRESCHLSVLDRGRLLVIAQKESPDKVRLSIEVGGTFEPARTASGRLLLAHLDDIARRAALGRNGPRLEPALDGIRRSGVSAADSETVRGVRDIAVLVGSVSAGLIAALAVTRLIRRGEKRDETALLWGLRTAAGEITNALGLGPRS